MTRSECFAESRKRWGPWCRLMTTGSDWFPCRILDGNGIEVGCGRDWSDAYSNAIMRHDAALESAVMAGKATPQIVGREGY